MDFGWILGGFWEAKIHDFRNFFDVNFLDYFLMDFSGFWEGFGRPPKIKIFVDFLGMLLETSFMVEISWFLH